MSNVDSTTVEYRDIPGFPGYCVGNDGSVWTSRRTGPKRTEHSLQKTIIQHRWKRLNPDVIKRGYLRVTLFPGRHRFLVHQLVLLAFVGPCPEGMEGCHFPDPSPHNNRVENLRWGTKKDNMQDRDKHGQTAKGSKHGCSKLTEDVVKKIREEYAVGDTSHSKLAKKYNISPPSIWFILHRVTWRHV